MGNQTLIYKEKLKNIIQEIEIHLKRIDEAFEELQKHLNFPLNENEFEEIQINKTLLAFADQIIYRFSKAQDTMGAKLFKTFLLYQGENVDKPFLDILSEFEKLKILDIDRWFVLREIRNEIAHEYESIENKAKDIINEIYKNRKYLKEILSKIKKLIKE
ncbi:hypothetical protein [Caminibacter sp.]